ncbi:MAG: hypothetical protein A2176_05495 [Spirochaetes bacterium RBG_13_51_14]|nr:MAG: hypothetical protein A2176_05495 [Spirochaetes bacterium RBG_13_51_14]
MGWQLNETNTGLAGVGIDKNSLPLYTGPIAPAANTTISMQKITGALWLYNGGITIDRCWIQPTGSQHLGSIIFTYDPTVGKWATSPTTITNCDIDGTAVTDPYIYADFAIRGSGIIAHNNNIYGMGDGIGLFHHDSMNSSIIQNYIHGLRGGNFGSPSQPSHGESMTIRNFGGSLCLVQNNYLESLINTSGSLFIQAWEGAIDNVTIEGNYLHTPNYCIVLNMNTHGYGSHIRVINNRFEKIGFGPIAYDGPAPETFTNNYYYNAGNPPENNGAAIDY